MMRVVNVSEIVEEAIKKSRKLKEGVIRGNWIKIVEKLSLKSEPLWIKDRVLYVLVEDSMYLHHMSINKNKYLNKIEELLKTDFVEDMRFKVSKVSKKNNESYVLNEEREKKGKFISELKNLSLEEKIEVLKNDSKEREKTLRERGYKDCIVCGTIFLGEEKTCRQCSLKNMDKLVEEKNDNE